MTEIVILGVGGYCVNLIEIVRDINRARGREDYRVSGFLDDDPGRIGTEYFGYPVLGPLTDAPRFADALFVNGIGSSANVLRKAEIIARTGMPTERFVTLVHPSAYVSDSAVIGTGTVVAQNCVIMAGARVGDHVKMLPAATVSYLSRVGDYSVVSTGAVALAEVQVGVSCYLGANCAIRERIRVADYCLIGMGAVVVRDVPERSVMVGNPARLLRRVEQ